MLFASDSQQFPWQVEVLIGLALLLLTVAAGSRVLASFVAKRRERQERRQVAYMNHDFRW